jgi:polyhydroxyalkanoate synthesis regulator protein
MEDFTLVSKGTSMKAVRLIKRYNNRKLYCTLESRYISLEDVSNIIDEREFEVVVHDQHLDKDVTRLTYLRSLAQIELNKIKREV